MYYNNILELIGNTPLLSLEETTGCHIYAKAEFLNPGGSIKDRIALNMLEEAEKRDHRKIGTDLDLFHIDEENPGEIFWHPNGWTIYSLIKDEAKVNSLIGAVNDAAVIYEENVEKCCRTQFDSRYILLS